MPKLRHLSIVLAGCLLAGSAANGVSAQPWMDRDRDRGRDWRDDDWRDREWRDRDRRWERDRRWRDRDENCYYTRREFRNRYGDIVVRRYRVCEE